MVLLGRGTGSSTCISLASSIFTGSFGFLPNTKNQTTNNITATRTREKITIATSLNFLISEGGSWGDWGMFWSDEPCCFWATNGVGSGWLGATCVISLEGEVSCCEVRSAISGGTGGLNEERLGPAAEGS